jgi:hypothetical protein
MKVYAKEAVPALIDFLSNSELQDKTIKTLQAITRENFGEDQDAWQAWWERQQ